MWHEPRPRESDWPLARIRRNEPPSSDRCLFGCSPSRPRRHQPMYIGMDTHKRYSQVAIMEQDGSLVDERRLEHANESRRRPEPSPRPRSRTTVLMRSSSPTSCGQTCLPRATFHRRRSDSSVISSGRERPSSKTVLGRRIEYERSWLEAATIMTANCSGRLARRTSRTSS